MYAGLRSANTCDIAQARSVRPSARELDHLGPLLRFLGDEFLEIGGREREHRATQVGKPPLHPGIGEAGIDLLVKAVDDRERSRRSRQQAAWQQGTSFWRGVTSHWNG